MTYTPSYQVARQLRMSPRCLSLLTSSLNVTVGEDRVDVGLNVKNAPKGLCVLDYVQADPNGQGWQYTTELMQILTAYKVI